MITYGWDLLRTQPLERLRTASPQYATNPPSQLLLRSALPERLPGTGGLIDPRSRFSVELERRSQELFDSSKSRRIGGRIIRDVDPALDTGIRVGERLPCLGVDNATHGLLLHDTAARGLRSGPDGWRGAEQGIIEQVVGIRILSELHILAGGPQTLDIRPTGCHGIVGGRIPVTQANGPIAHVGILSYRCRCKERTAEGRQRTRRPA